MKEELKNAFDEAFEVDVFINVHTPYQSILKDDFLEIKKRVTAAFEIALRQRDGYLGDCRMNCYGDEVSEINERLAKLDDKIIEALR